MADWSFIEGQRFTTLGVDTNQTSGTLINPGNPAHTKGSFVQLTAGIGYSPSAMIVNIAPDQTSGWGALVDIAIGAAGSEQVIASNLAIGSDGDYDKVASYLFNISIPDTRVAARVQSLSQFGYTNVSVVMLGQGLISPSPLSRITTYGASTANTNGATITPAVTANTKGTWVAVGTTTNPIREMLIGFPDSFGYTDYLLDVAIGASGSETILLSNFHLRNANAGNPVPNPIPPLRLTIPASTRIAARCQATYTSSDPLTMIIYGVD